jgi:hypothetical protein
MTKSLLLRIMGCFLLLNLFSTVSIIAEEKETEETEETAEEIEKKKEEEEKKKEKLAELKAQFDYSFDDISDKLVIISCKSDSGRSAGSGFIAKMNGRTYLVTNQHVIMGAETISMKTASGERLTPKSVELSRTRDIARILIDDRDAFTISEKFAYGIPMGVFGNSEGAGVATELYGEVTGLGTDLVEVTAEFVSGNSGSPVLDQNQNVIGIASYVKVSWIPPSKKEKDDQSEAEKEKAKSKTRRFCYRLTDLEWQRVKWKSYNNKYGKIYCNADATTTSIFNIISAMGQGSSQIPITESMPSDLQVWVKKYNNRKTSFESNIEDLSELCLARSRQIRLFATQDKLTGFLASELTNSYLALEYAGRVFENYADTH